MTGKVDRHRLPYPGPVPIRDGRGPGNEIVRCLAGIWSELLGLSHVDVHDSFFAKGGHSLLVPRLAALIHDRLGVIVPLWECFAQPSLAGLAATVAAARSRGVDIQPLGT